jgi:hypothetical protein
MMPEPEPGSGIVYWRADQPKEGSMRTANAHVLTHVLAALALLSGVAGAAEYHLNAEGTGDFPTIQAAMDSVASGDTIWLADGTYTGPGNRDIAVPAVTFQMFSESSDATVCIIVDNEVDGFQGLAGGVYCSAGALLQFWNCEIVSNTAPRAGGMRVSGNVNV